MKNQIQNLPTIDRFIHEPARLILVAMLSTVESADFLFLLKQSGLTKGNLSVQLTRLEESSYVEISKTFRGKIPHSEYRLTQQGRLAFQEYRKNLDAIIEPRKDATWNLQSKPIK